MAKSWGFQRNPPVDETMTKIKNSLQRNSPSESPARVGFPRETPCNEKELEDKIDRLHILLECHSKVLDNNSTKTSTTSMIAHSALVIAAGTFALYIDILFFKILVIPLIILWAWEVLNLVSNKPFKD